MEEEEKEEEDTHTTGRSGDAEKASAILAVSSKRSGSVLLDDFSPFPHRLNDFRQGDGNRGGEAVELGAVTCLTPPCVVNGFVSPHVSISMDRTVRMLPSQPQELPCT